MPWLVLTDKFQINGFQASSKAMFAGFGRYDISMETTGSIPSHRTSMLSLTG